LINYPELLLLGAIAGLTIFLGLPLAAVGGMSQKRKGFLNAVATGILIFLTVDVFSHAWQSAEDDAVRAFTGSGPLLNPSLSLLAMFGGIALGLLGLTFYGTRYMKQSFVQVALNGSGSQNRDTAYGKQELQLIQQVDSYRMSMMIAIGIGAHNLSEGLAIGQSYTQGAIGLALILILGFAAHNATEGFGIAAPLTGLSNRPSARFLVLAGLIGGGPTFIGTLLGSLWSSTIAYIFFLSLAGGALVYVTMLMYNAGRRQAANNILMIGFFFGILAGFITDLLVTLAGV
jgi:ZIP family zinc transporter